MIARPGRYLFAKFLSESRQELSVTAGARARYQPVTMSPFVLYTIAKSSFFSEWGTPNLALVSSKSLQKAAHCLRLVKGSCPAHPPDPKLFRLLEIFAGKRLPPV